MLVIVAVLVGSRIGGGKWRGCVDNLLVRCAYNKVASSTFGAGGN